MILLRAWEMILQMSLLAPSIFKVIMNQTLLFRILNLHNSRCVKLDRRPSCVGREVMSFPAKKIAMSDNKNKHIVG